MRNLVQLVLPSKNIHPRAERAGPRGGERSFSDALQIKPGKIIAVAGKEAASADAPSTPAAIFRIKIGSHGLTTGLPVSAALRSELPQIIAADAEEEGEPAIDTDDLEETAEEIPSGESTPDAVLPEIALPVEPELFEAAHAAPDSDAMAAGPAQVPAPTGDVAEAPVVAPAVRLEPGSKPARARTDSAGEPDAVESEPPRTATAAKAIGRPALASAPTNANVVAKAPPPATDGNGGQQAAANSATGEAEPKPAIDPERESRAAPQMPVGESRSEAPRIPASVRVLEAQSFPAPPQVSPPSVSVTSAIAAAPDWTSFVRSPEIAALGSAPGAAPIKSLTIQLHPAELGAVTAKLRFVGEQLTIELQVERPEAYDRLSMDRETMLKAVRALGIEVDKITVQQPQASNGVNARSENSATFNGGGGREAGFSAPGGSGGRESGGPNGSQGGNGREDAPGQHPGAGHGNQNPEGRGLYI